MSPVLSVLWLEIQQFLFWLKCRWITFRRWHRKSNQFTGGSGIKVYLWKKITNPSLLPRFWSRHGINVRSVFTDQTCETPMFVHTCYVFLLNIWQCCYLCSKKCVHIMNNRRTWYIHLQFFWGMVLLIFWDKHHKGNFKQFLYCIIKSKAPVQIQVL